ncbi:hypothetical protein CBW65_13975 [Tumebacillus avium]|uniref:Uncharacterized protein n=1 Tax=Tumebacillus avium TaxID=1903704 RepID=A0A1Y0IQ72_9BACL|nr:hypothetical protein [Tumebacillus avium]ARU61986.1 hypothetical protein CBW65_13975 [Tumebacillus avium]
MEIELKGGKVHKLTTGDEIVMKSHQNRHISRSLNGKRTHVVEISNEHVIVINPMTNQRVRISKHNIVALIVNQSNILFVENEPYIDTVFANDNLEVLQRTAQRRKQRGVSSEGKPVTLENFEIKKQEQVSDNIKLVFDQKSGLHIYVDENIPEHENDSPSLVNIGMQTDTDQTLSSTTTRPNTFRNPKITEEDARREMEAEMQCYSQCQLTKS